MEAVKPHEHNWLPLIDLELNAGSLGSQVGYCCLDCGEKQILWPKGAAAHNVGENNLTRMNELKKKEMTHLIYSRNNIIYDHIKCTSIKAFKSIVKSLGDVKIIKIWKD